MFYSVCPICGCYHDDGAFIFIPSELHSVLGGRIFFICLDCGDKYTDKQVIEILKEKYWK